MGKNRFKLVIGAAVIALGIGLLYYFQHFHNTNPGNNLGIKTAVKSRENPIAGVQFYADNERDIVRTVQDYKNKGDTANADLLNKISSQPGTTWLTGPRPDDSLGDHDIDQVKRTSDAATVSGMVPLYQLYAIPGRDACADYSKGGFTSSADYLAWIDKIIANLQSKAVFSVEADGVAQTIHDKCLSPQQITDRYALLKTAIAKLSASPKVMAVYLDAGHSEWFPDPAVLVKPLHDSGLDQADGIAVNVSFFVPTHDITIWSQNLVRRLGGNKGIIIDTSRNGRGVPPKQITGDARFCNPAGRGLGPIPNTAVSQEFVDAYFYGKIAGESDGDCRGNAPAGSFDVELALELAKNAKQSR